MTNSVRSADVQAALAAGRWNRKHPDKNGLEAHSQDYTNSQVAISSRWFSRHWGGGADPNRNESNLRDQLDTACRAEFGFAMTELMEFIGTLLTVGYEINPGVAVAPLEFVVEQISEAQNWDTGKTQQILEFLSLRERVDFLQPPPGFKREHIYPWRFGRPLSYIRRPLLLRAKNTEIEVVWGKQARGGLAEEFRVDCYGRQIHPAECRNEIPDGRIAKQGRAEFNKRVANFLNQRPRTVVKERVKSLGRLSLTNLGDIDVVAADMSRRILYLVECKDLSMARTPYELATEIRELILGSDNDKSAVEKHSARVDFIRHHAQAAVEWMGGNPRSAWKISPILVVDEPLMSPRMERCPIPVVAIDLLDKYLK